MDQANGPIEKSKWSTKACRLASNESVIVNTPLFNPETSLTENVATTERQIRFAEWDETDDAANLLRLEEVPREVAFLWAGEEPIATLVPSQSEFWNNFLQISGWTQDRPDDISFFNTTPDGEWFYLQTATFADADGALSPQDDFATVWQFVIEQEFADPNNVVVNDALTPKIEAEILINPTATEHLAAVVAYDGLARRDSILRIVKHDLEAILWQHGRRRRLGTTVVTNLRQTIKRRTDGWLDQPIRLAGRQFRPP